MAQTDAAAPLELTDKMEITEKLIDRWLERGGKFFKTIARNPVVRETLRARGLSDEEMNNGWKLYSDLHGFGGDTSARPATKQTGAAQALNELDAWDAPTFAAAAAVLSSHYPIVSRYLFQNLQASEGPAAVAGVERFLDRVKALRDGVAEGINPDDARAAAALLATRKIIDLPKDAELRALIEKTRIGARSEEVVPATQMPTTRRDTARAFFGWLNEWREVARHAINRRDYRISLGLAQRRAAAEEGEAEEPTVVAGPGQ